MPDQHHIDRVFDMMSIERAIKTILAESRVVYRVPVEIRERIITELAVKIMRAVMESGMIDDCYLESYRLIQKTAQKTTQIV